MDHVHVVRHKVLVEGRTQRAVARELGLARVTVRKYVDQAAPTRKLESRAAAAAGLGRGRRAGAGGAGRIGAMDRRQTAADRHATARAVADRGAPRRRDHGQRGGRGMEAAAPRGLRAADVSAGRSGRGRFLRGAGRRRRDAPQGVALPDAADVLGPRLRVDLRARRIKSAFSTGMSARLRTSRAYRPASRTTICGRRSSGSWSAARAR